MKNLINSNNAKMKHNFTQLHKIRVYYSVQVFDKLSSQMIYDSGELTLAKALEDLDLACSKFGSNTTKELVKFQTSGYAGTRVVGGNFEVIESE